MSKTKSKNKDVAVVIGKNNDGTYEVARYDGNNVSFGNVGAIKDGQSISGDDEIIRMTPSGIEGVLNVESIHKSQNKKDGPVQVSNELYRSGWDSIFGSRVIGEA